MYISQIYNRIIESKKIYTRKKIIIPRPEFFVLYNGVEHFDDEKTLKLSDSFENVGSLGLPLKDSPALELVVKVININEGRNKEIVQRCETLAEYSAFIGKVREFEKEYTSLKKAMKEAVEYCLEHDIMKEFLGKNKKEVVNMLMTEWKLEDALAVRYEEGKEDGIEQGIEQGMEKTARNALAEGASFEFIQKITGLEIEAIKNLQMRA